MKWHGGKSQARQQQERLKEEAGLRAGRWPSEAIRGALQGHVEGWSSVLSSLVS